MAACRHRTWAVSSSARALAAAPAAPRLRKSEENRCMGGTVRVGCCRRSSVTCTAGDHPLKACCPTPATRARDGGRPAGAYARPVPVTVETATEVTDELVDAFARLVPQLSRSSPPPDAGILGEIVAAPATELLVARGDGGEIVGSLTLALFRIPTGLRAWIEDVVVDDAARGQGVGEALNRRAIELAHERGARSIDLTSRPSREAANRLYRRLGFEQRDTNVYRYEG
ncbi:MAG TPA: GNAT family N-acetyltransferase [Aquihabitans sp.]|nr:GNAT family N-acetyltransferase [Aquihabitans sp.]